MRAKFLLFFIVLSTYSLSQNKSDTILFSHNSGVYKDSVLLSLSNLNEDKIYYSDNGDYPKTEYIKPILIKNSTTIRVKNSKTNKGYTRNYILPGRKITLPIICLTIKPSDLYDSTAGIYVKGANASSEPPYLGANFHKNWERIAYLELIDTNNSVELNQKIGIKIFGQFSAMLPQKSFSIHARKKYGNKRIKYQLFPDLPYKKYKSFILRNSGSDNCNTHMRDVMMTSLVKNFNLDVQNYRSCVVYLNGKYWGVYHMREKINEHFIKQHYKVDKDSIAIMKHRSDVQHYGRLNYTRLIKYIKKTSFESDSNLNELAKLIDIDNYLDYTIAQIYFSNIDAGGNIRYWREFRKDAKWRWILFDTDFGFGLRKGNGADENTLKRFTEYSSEKWPFPAWSTLIIRKLLENDSIKDVFLQKFNYHLNTTFQSNNVKNHIDGISKTMEMEMPYHMKRWKRKPQNWIKEVENLKEFADVRPDYLFQFLKEKFNIDTSYKLTIDYDKERGIVFLDEFELDSGYNGIHLDSINSYIKAEPKFGYDFSHWSGGNTSINSKLNLESDTLIKAYFMKKDKSKLKDLIYFNEIGIEDSLGTSYIELYNSTDSVVDISNWILRNNNKIFSIRDEVYMNPKSYYILFRKKSMDSLSIEVSQGGLFKIHKGDKLELFTAQEKLVEKLNLKKSYFKETNKIEFVNSTIENKWVSTNMSSINKINNMQKKSEENNFKILIGFISLLSLIIFTSLYFFLRNRKKRLHSSIE